jgi:UDP-2-acetamido-3-amino-2,3-dideoxy-glucuronate N-acetyltransferase
VAAKDVPDYGFIMGVPGRLKGYMSRHGHLLKFDEQGLATCPESRFRYQLTNDIVKCLDLDEEAPLPAELAEGKTTYDDFKA